MEGCMYLVEVSIGMSIFESYVKSYFDHEYKTFLSVYIVRSHADCNPLLIMNIRPSYWYALCVEF